jgi:hypothetical protein
MATKTLATSHLIQTRKSLSNVSQELSLYGIRTLINNDIIIFSLSHSTKNTEMNIYKRECNGLILAHDGTPIVVPPRSLKYNIDSSMANKYIHQGLYHIYKVEDGTSFNMYYRGRWVISTMRGYDMNNVKWGNSATYQDIISECLEKIGLTWELFTEKLSLDQCYSFGFKHPHMHKFREGKDTDIYKLWFIQSVITDPSNSNFLWANSVCPIAIIPSQDLHDSVVSNIGDLYTLAANSLAQFQETGEICYGFILRSVNVEVTNSHSDLFIESSLMRYIRKFCYDNKIIDMCHINKWDKDTAVSLYAYLDRHNYNTFVALFGGQFKSYITKYEEMFADIVNKMVASSRDAKADTSSVADIFLKMFKDNVRYDVSKHSDEELKKIYTEYITHPESIYTIMDEINQTTC